MAELMSKRPGRGVRPTRLPAGHGSGVRSGAGSVARTAVSLAQLRAMRGAARAPGGGGTYTVDARRQAVIFTGAGARGSTGPVDIGPVDAQPTSSGPRDGPGSRAAQAAARAAHRPWQRPVWPARGAGHVGPGRHPRRPCRGQRRHGFGRHRRGSWCEGRGSRQRCAQVDPGRGSRAAGPSGRPDRQHPGRRGAPSRCLRAAASRQANPSRQAQPRPSTVRPRPQARSSPAPCCQATQRRGPGPAHPGGHSVPRHTLRARDRPGSGPPVTVVTADAATPWRADPGGGSRGDAARAAPRRGHTNHAGAGRERCVRHRRRVGSHDSRLGRRPRRARCLARRRRPSRRLPRDNRCIPQLPSPRETRSRRPGSLRTPGPRRPSWPTSRARRVR